MNKLTEVIYICSFMQFSLSLGSSWVQEWLYRQNIYLWSSCLWCYDIC